MISCRKPLGVARPALRLLSVVAVVAAWPAADAVAAGPSNDDFNHAEPIRPSTTFRGTTVGATTERGEPRPYRRARTVWYRFRSERKVTVALAICPPNRGLPYLTAVSVYTGRSLRSLRPVDFRRASWLSDEYMGPICSRRVAFTAKPRRSYRIAVAGDTSYPCPLNTECSGWHRRTGRGGPFGLRVRVIDAPPNDDFAGAASITVGETVRGTTYNATLELGEPIDEWGSYCTVWYQLRVSVPTEVEWFGADQVSVYTGRKLNRLTLVEEYYPLETKPGVTYHIQVSSPCLPTSRDEARMRRLGRFELSLRVYNQSE